MTLAYLLMYIILQPVNSGVVILNPDGNVMNYVNNSILFNCHHSNNEAVTFKWTTNANSTVQPLLENFRTISSNSSMSSTFTIIKALYAFNELEIQCQANTTNGDVLYSRKAKLLLQGTLTAVKDLNISINDYSICLTWSAPVTLFENSYVRYLVAIVNMTTSNSSIDVTPNTSYTLMSQNRRIGCDNYMFTITPENSAGLGETQSIYHNNEDLNVTNRYLTLNSVEKLDILLSLTSPLCEIKEMLILNKNLNDTEIKEEKFKNFVLISSAQERYQYLLKLNLQRRFEYELNMSLSNAKGDVHINFSFNLANLQPNGDVIKYVNDDFVFTCILSQPSIEIDWIINETRYEEGSPYYYTFIERDTSLLNHTISKISAQNVSKNLNQTEIYCVGRTQNNLQYISRTATILLQGPPEGIVSPEISLIDFNVYLNWKRPHSIIKNDDIQYLVMVENRTSSIITKRDFSIETFFSITSYTSRRIACDDLVFIIIPKNKAGEGNSTTVYLLNKAPKILDFSLTLVEDTYYTVDLEMNSPICTIPFIMVENINLNVAYIKQDRFTDFTLEYTRSKNYHYRLDTLKFPKRFEINFNMNISNSNSTEWTSFKISTHAIKEVIISSSRENQLQLRIQANNFLHTRNYGGAFIALLYCTSQSCHEIDYNNSMYITTNQIGPFHYNESYKSGFYEIYAYDTSTDGVVFSSGDNGTISYSIPLQQIYLENLATLTTNSTSPKHSNCSYGRSNTSVTSQCDIKKSDVSKQQLLLNSVVNKSKMYVSAPTDKDKIVCLLIEFDDEDYLAINTPILNFTEVYVNEPIGRSINFIQSFGTGPPCNSNQSQDNVPLIVSLSVGLPIILGVSIVVGLYLFWNKCKKCRDYYEVNKKD